MTSEPKLNLFEDLQARGEAVLDEMCSEGRDETLHLEFKTLAGPVGRKIAKDDLAMLAKALGGFANAEGGILLIGVATKKEDGLDVADRPVPLSKLRSVTNRVVAALPELLSQQHEGIDVLSIPARGGRDSGYLCIRVPPSERRPHMSVKQHQFFRRTSDGTRVMDHGEVRDLFLAPREPQLKLEWRVFRGSQLSNNAREVVIGLRVANVGRIAARNIFVRFRSHRGPNLAIEAQKPFGKMGRPSGVMMVVPPAGSVLHVGDSDEVARVSIILRPRVPKRYSPDPHNPVVSQTQMRTAEFWETSQSLRQDALFDPFEQLVLAMTYGAENGAADDGELVFSLDALLSGAEFSDDELYDIFNHGIPKELLSWREAD